MALSEPRTVFLRMPIEATSLRASGVMWNSTLCMAKRYLYCLMSAFLGSVSTRTISSRVNPLVFTTTGKRPTNSGISPGTPRQAGIVVSPFACSKPREPCDPPTVRDEVGGLDLMVGVALGALVLERRLAPHGGAEADGRGGQPVRDHVLEPRKGPAADEEHIIRVHLRSENRGLRGRARAQTSPTPRRT
jgi:hypothetical protein